MAEKNSSANYKNNNLRFKTYDITATLNLDQRAIQHFTLDSLGLLGHGQPDTFHLCPCL